MLNYLKRFILNFFPGSRNTPTMELIPILNVAPNADLRSFKDEGMLYPICQDIYDISVINAGDGSGDQLTFGLPERKPETSLESDPNGVEQHSSGAKLDAGKLRAG